MGSFEKDPIILINIMVLFMMVVIRVQADILDCSFSPSPQCKKILDCPESCPTMGTPNRDGFYCAIDCEACISVCTKIPLIWCLTPGTRCYGQQTPCPLDCPNSISSDPDARVCHLDCDAPICLADCKIASTLSPPTSLPPTLPPAPPATIWCNITGSRCEGKSTICPIECPTLISEDPRTKVCYFDCNSPLCRAQCKYHRPNCDIPGSACYDPRFIGGDGIVFYFHGKSNGHFVLVSDINFQINGRFIGHRPAGRTRDFTWIQALGILFGTHSFSLEATKTSTWNEQIYHLKFTFDHEEFVLPEGSLSEWQSQEKDIKVERVSNKNSVVVILRNKVELMVKVVPITKEEEKVHNYQLPDDDRFVHLEVQFKFFNLSSKVDGVLGRTYRPDFENPAMPGVAMPTLGGEEKYSTTSLFSVDCKSCVFSPGNKLKLMTLSI